MSAAWRERSKSCGVVVPAHGAYYAMAGLKRALGEGASESGAHTGDKEGF
jgi:hypothetical protein